MYVCKKERKTERKLIYSITNTYKHVLINLYCSRNCKLQCGSEFAIEPVT